MSKTIGEHDSKVPVREHRAHPPVPPTESSFTTFARPAAAPASVLQLWAIYASVTLIFGALRIPHDLSFFMFAFGDRGSWLVVQYLTAHGARPTIDFGYLYGLLPIAVGRVWFATFGLTPVAFKLAMATGGVAMALGVARFASAMRLSRLGQALIIVALPIAIQSSLPSLAHLLEAVLLCFALAEHSRGNRSAALALTTAACFAKPALGYAYGFLLILLIVVDCPRLTQLDGKRRLDRLALLCALRPAAITGLLLAVMLGSIYGATPLVASLLPLSGLKIYRALALGFFSPWSRTFWDPRGVPIANYFATVAPFWIGSTVWIALAGVLAGWRWWSSPHDDQSNRNREEIILSCAILQTLFVLRMFGPPLSWTYYPYLLVMGVAAASVLNSRTALFTSGLIMVALMAQIVSFSAAALEWKIKAPAAATAGLWVNAGERAEWRAVSGLIGGHRTFAVSIAGGAPILFPNLEKPVAAYLVHGLTTPAEVARTVEEIKTVDLVIRPASESIGDPISFWPELTQALNGLEVIWKGRLYQVCRRKSEK
jgi:hypothetical protein